jgi:hypothetical protein
MIDQIDGDALVAIVRMLVPPAAAGEVVSGEVVEHGPPALG